jgi:hypothetical protein
MTLGRYTRLRAPRRGGYAMPTKRKKLSPTRINQPMPAWAQRLLETGEEPARDSPDADQFFGYAFCQESVVGLPPADELLWSDARKPAEKLGRAKARHQAPIGEAPSPVTTRARPSWGIVERNSR